MSDADRSAPSWGDQPHAPPEKTPAIAIASLALGVVGLTLVPLICSLIATYLGYRARNEIDASRGRLGGRGLAVSGIVLGWIGSASFVAVVLVIATVTAFGVDVQWHLNAR